jgi:dipeptidyl aminopeptidase/acylaminoacyl peptidase
MNRHLSFLVVFILAVAAIGTADQRPFNVHDLVAMQRIADPRPSPDGSRVAFVVTTMDLAANKGRKDIWIATTDGSGGERLTTHIDNDWGPRWHADGTLYFLSSRSDKVQVWRWDFASGRAHQVTDLPLDVGEMAVGPKGALYVGLAVFPDCADSIPCTVQRLQAREDDKASGLIFDQVFVRHWDTWKDGRRNHVFRVPIGADGAAGAAVDLMQGVDGDCPTIPWGGDGDFTVSPDGAWLVYTAKVVDGSEEVWSTDWDLWAVPTDGSAPARCLTEDNEAWDTSPAFSPNGSKLAYLAMARPGYEADRRRVMVMDWSSGETQNVTEPWDRSPGSLIWSPDSTGLYTSADNLGNHSIFRVDPSDGMIHALATVHTNSSPQPLADGRVLFARDSLVSPVELYVMAADGSEPTQITHLNDQRLAGISFGRYKQFSFPGANFLIHGGPQGSFDDHWHYRWNPQIYAGHGYATVMIDFHGSTGYGQDFTDAINGDWGGAPFIDLMKGLDHVLLRHPWIDSERMAAAGASFGGYMINWVQGHTDRFKALVCHDGNLDELMAYFDTEELWFPEWEHGGTPWENPDGYRKHSPVNHVQNWKTPELVIHGALDYRVVDTQGLATFNALQRLGVPSRLLYYPDENHWVLKPINSIQWHEVVLDWMDLWTAPGTN